MARLYAFNKSVPVTVDILVEKKGAMPNGSIRFTSEDGKEASAFLNFQELMVLAAGIASDPRLKTGGRNGKPDAKYQADVDDLYERIKR